MCPEVLRTLETYWSCSGIRPDFVKAMFCYCKADRKDLQGVSRLAGQRLLVAALLT